MAAQDLRPSCLCAWPGFAQLLRASHKIPFVSVLCLRQIMTLGCAAQAVAAQDSRLSLADFLCARPGCAQLLREPVVLNCGCCVCLACRPPLDGQCPRCGAISVTTPVVCSKVYCLIHPFILHDHGKCCAKACPAHLNLQNVCSGETTPSADVVKRPLLVGNSIMRTASWVVIWAVSCPGLD